jgi:hypothetical protein
MATNLPNLAVGALGSVYSISPVGGGGGNSTWTTVTAAPSYYHTGNIYANVPSYNNDIIIRRDGKEDLHVAKTLEMLMDRLCIIQPAIEMLEKYPALRDAYENYKLIEAMVKNGKDEDEL